MVDYATKLQDLRTRVVFAQDYLFWVWQRNYGEESSLKNFYEALDDYNDMAQSASKEMGA